MVRRVSDVVAPVLLIALALMPLRPVYGADALLVPVVGGLLLGAAVAYLAAARQAGVVITVAIALVVYMIAGPALADRAHVVSGVLPTAVGLREVCAGLVTSWVRVLTVSPELGTGGGFLVAPYALAFIGAVVSVTVARRTKGAGGSFAVAPALAALIVSMVLADARSFAGVACGVGFVAFAVLWAAYRCGSLDPRRGGVLATGLVLALVGGALLGPPAAEVNDRYVLREAMTPPFDPRDYPSPLAGFRQYLKNSEDKELFTVQGLPKGASIRLATMDSYDGIVWNVAGNTGDSGSGDFERVGPHIPGATAGKPQKITIAIRKLHGVWLPTVGQATSLTMSGRDAAEVREDLRYNSATGTAALPTGITAGLTYTLDTRVPRMPTDGEIAKAAKAGVALPRLDHVPEQLQQTASTYAGEAATAGQTAQALVKNLREDGYFSHGQEGDTSGGALSLAGHGADRMTTLVTADTMVGDQEQYASAMSLMARQLGLPSRVVIGFAPDRERSEDQKPPERDPKKTLSVKGADVDAWVEIKFDGLGWVEFRPSPDEDKKPREQEQKQEPKPRPQVVQPPLQQAQPEEPPDEDNEAPDTEGKEDLTEANRIWRIAATVAVIVAVPLVIIALPLLIIWLLKRRRCQRRRRASAPVMQMANGWDELLDHARDLRLMLPVNATRLETAESLETQAGEGEPLGAVMLAQVGDAAVFAAENPTPQQVEWYWRAVNSASRNLRARFGRWRRCISMFSLRSLRRRK